MPKNYLIRNKRDLIVDQRSVKYHLILEKDMTIPDFETIMLPLLQCVKDGKDWSMGDVEKSLVAKFELSEEEANQLKPSSTTETLFQNRMRWARFYLKKAGLLEDPQRGYTRITSEGLEALDLKPTRIDIKFLMNYPDFVKFYSKKKTEVGTVQIPVQSKTPEDMVIEGITEIRRGLEADILEKMKNCTPSFFERIVVQLLEKMGYGVGKVTGRTGDGGIDGMIKQDKLGLDEIYIQTKKWANPVRQTQLRDFAGALAGTKSKKGIFLTTSNFSDDAIEYVKTLDSKIVLIDGEKLVKLMFDYNVGFEPGDNYQLKKIDENYFEE